MKIILLLLPVLIGVGSLTGCQSTQKQKEKEENEEYDGPGLLAKYEFDHQKDATGVVHRELLWPAIEYTQQLKADLQNGMPANKGTFSGWIERGPNRDSVGPSNGNTRAGVGQVASGRIRAILVDAADATGNTVFVGGVAGGLWKTTNIIANPAGWVPVNDKFSNLAITGICQSPVNAATIYFCTGEAVYNADAVRGDGIFKSTDGGATFTQLASTTNSSYSYIFKIMCDTAGNVYAATRNGLKRSLDGGASWTDITPTGINNSITDIQISSTGRMHITAGQFAGTVYYRYTDNPATVSASSGWSSATTSFPTASMNRAVLACQGNTLLALPASSSTEDVATIYQSTDGGATWAALANTPSFTSGQGWYCLAAAICPSAPSKYLVGSLDCYRTTNAGASAWTKVSAWTGAGTSYVHADQHNAVWYNTATQSRVLVACDGGLHLSIDSGKTFTDRNIGLRIKQFYSCAISPSVTNYLIGGAQDNGCHQFYNAGLSGSIEFIGGDGCSVHIDQNQSQYQFGSYVYNVYRRSTNSGSTWSSITLNSSSGQFVNPTDYDHTANIMYCGDAAGSYRVWSNPQTGSTSTTYSIAGFASNSVYAISVSPYVSNRVYFGLNNGTVFRVDNANTGGTSATNMGVSTNAIANVAFGSSEDVMVVTSSGYTGTQVYYSANATAATPTWTASDGNLPNMPVRWAIVVPGYADKRVVIATETGVWYTRDITASPVTWLPDASFPNVRTDMLRLRTSDNTIAAATHGRGMWTANINDLFSIALPVTDFALSGAASSGNVALKWTYRTARSAVKFDVERSSDGITFTYAGSVQAGTGLQSYTYNDPRTNSGRLYYRIKSYDQYGLTEYSNTVSFGPGTVAAFSITKLYPNPARDQVSVSIFAPGETDVTLQVFDISGKAASPAMVRHASTGSTVMNIDVTSMPPGNYLLTAIVGQKRYVQKFVKQ